MNGANPANGFPKYRPDKSLSGRISSECSATSQFNFHLSMLEYRVKLEMWTSGLLSNTPAIPKKRDPIAISEYVYPLSLLLEDNPAPNVKPCYEQVDYDTNTVDSQHYSGDPGYSVMHHNHDQANGTVEQVIRGKDNTFLCYQSTAQSNDILRNTDQMRSNEEIFDNWNNQWELQHSASCDELLFHNLPVQLPSLTGVSGMESAGEQSEYVEEEGQQEEEGQEEEEEARRLEAVRAYYEREKLIEQRRREEKKMSKKRKWQETGTGTGKGNGSSKNNSDKNI